MTNSIQWITRRNFLRVASASTLPAISHTDVATGTSVNNISDCILTPQVVEGPYYLDPKLIRGNIREGKQGVPMRVQLRVIDARSCGANGAVTPLASVRLDVWQADARGVYSGYADQGDDATANTLGQTYLRGTQMTDADGWVMFDTIYPGWYSGRCPHFHFKAFLDQRNLIIGELHFPDALSEFIYANVSGYGNRLSARSVINVNDSIARLDAQHLTYCSIKEERDRFLASFVIGVDRGFDAAAAAAAKRAARPASDERFNTLPPNQAGPPHLALRNRTAALVPGSVKR